MMLSFKYAVVANMFCSIRCNVMSFRFSLPSIGLTSPSSAAVRSITGTGGGNIISLGLPCFGSLLSLSIYCRCLCRGTLLVPLLVRVHKFGPTDSCRHRTDPGWCGLLGDVRFRFVVMVSSGEGLLGLGPAHCLVHLLVFLFGSCVFFGECS